MGWLARPVETGSQGTRTSGVIGNSELWNLESSGSWFIRTRSERFEIFFNEASETADPTCVPGGVGWVRFSIMHAASPVTQRTPSSVLTSTDW